MANRFSVESVFKAIDKFTAPVKGMHRTLKRFTVESERGLRRLSSVGDSFTSGFRRGLTSVTFAFVAFTAVMSDAVMVGAEFDKTLVAAGARFASSQLPDGIRKGTEAFKELSEAARTAAKGTEFTARETASALNFFAKAGFDLTASIGALPLAIDLATVAGVDLGRTADIITDSLGAFNMRSDDSVQNLKNLERVSDVLGKTVIRSNVSLEEMFEGIKLGAPIAVKAGQSLETVASMIGVLGNVGIKGTRTSTAIKNIMLALSAPSENVRKILRRLNVEILNNDKSVRDSVDTFRDFNTAIKALPNSQQLAIFDEIFGKIPIAAAINLSNASDELREFRTEITNITGFGKRLGLVMRDTLSGDLDKLKASVESVKISIFSMNEGALRNTVQRITEWTDAHEELIATNITEFISKIIDNFEEIVATGKKIAAVTVVIFSLIFAVKALIAVLTLVNLVMAANPVVLIVLGVVALIAALVLLIVKFDLVKAWFLDLPTWAKIAFAAFSPITGLIAAAALIMEHWEPIKAFFGSLWSDISDGFTGMIDTISGGFKALGSDFLGLPKFLLDSGRGTASDFIKGLFGGGAGQDSSPQVASPQERTAHSIQESRTFETNELLIRTDPGVTAEVSGGGFGGKLQVQPTGAF